MKISSTFAKCFILFLALFAMTHAQTGTYNASKVCEVFVNFFDFLGSGACAPWFGKTIQLTSYGESIIQRDKTTPVCDDVQSVVTTDTCLYENGTVETALCAETYFFFYAYADICRKYYSFNHDDRTELAELTEAYVYDPCTNCRPYFNIELCQRIPQSAVPCSNPSCTSSSVTSSSLSSTAPSCT